ncbi:hypothetical protein HMPREF1486_03116 [Streptomyces sp. HPH0547]|uniref:DNA cytosine methyltransferase n=1 Tax=Streptomyces sp. HPH0547 TaxID=1203592 RepID=UPI00034E3835|nr:DNA cytosine methyltransferase [Streptomyces sp. HPH0547]EPD94563.1 hypothetical protein HMPREF1486_03116 [Streptomyces sp. HPH0547]
MFDAVDLFAGPGGWDVAARGLGLHTVGLELDAAACATRAAAGHPTIRCDIAQYPTAPFAGVRGLIASPPCQGFSRAGKRGGINDLEYAHQAVHDLAHGRDTRTQLAGACKDKRTILVAEPMRYAAALRPEWVCLEQVPDVLPIWRQYAELLRSWGYSVWAGELNAADYGVPQTRRRAILIASRVRTVGPPPPTHAKEPADGLFGDTLARWVSMADALGLTEGLTVNTRGDRKTAGGNEFSADGPSWSLTEKTRSWALRNGTQANACTRNLDEPAGTLFFGARCNDVSWVLRNGNQPNAAIRGTHEPAPTVAFGNNAARVEWVPQRPATTVCSTDRIAPPGHRDRSANGDSQFASPDTIRITQAEAAVLQSFPADYPWQGTKTKQFEQIGNAVPVLLAAHVLAAATGITAAAPTTPVAA